ncbi:hypothetical protein PQX77_012257 [Marasmius sp. AFHP31]|nr:hypothetical protein PQX77_012257 [Marasmius sp. AFHP31]
MSDRASKASHAHSEDDFKQSVPASTPSPLAKIEEVYNTEYEKALANTSLDPLSKRSFQLYFIVMVGFLNAVSSGFDGSLMGGINAMPQYLSYFNEETVGKSTGIVFMIYVVGNCAGSLFAGPVTDIVREPSAILRRTYGLIIVITPVRETRRHGGAFILVGSAIVTAATGKGMFLGGRFLLGFGIAISTTAAPTWVTELAPPQWRGRLGALYNSCFFIGSIPATGAMVGTEKMNSTWAWRLPLVLQIVPPAIVMTCVWFCPESPRWLVQKGKLDEAKEILIKYHGTNGESNAIVEASGLLSMLG